MIILANHTIRKNPRTSRPNSYHVLSITPHNVAALGRGVLFAVA
jgi:hypothetical protein